MKQKAPFQPVPHEAVTRWGPGEAPEVWVPGDFILSRGTSPLSRLISFGQSVRIHGRDRVFAHWSHAALVVSETGDLIEANRPGVIRSHVKDYEHIDYRVVHTGADDHDRQQAVEFAEWCVDHLKLGRLIFFSLGLSMLTGRKFSFFSDGTTLCSGLVARAQERTGAIFNRAPTHIAPADLAKYYDVRP